MSESATTIDKLSIEITSNSTGASQGIDALAASLGRLKTNGSVGVAVKNLNNLSEALRKLSPVASNANKLSSLANSINELSQVGSFTKVVNQLNRLPGALKGLSNLNIDNDLGAKLERLAQATTPLSNIKTGGLGTMVNALSKIGKVTDALDDDTINRFADRVGKLNDKLTPLSTKMTTIQQGLRGVNSSARSASGGVRNLGSDVNATTLNMASMVTVVRGVIDALRPVVQMLSNTISQAIEWDGISARFGRGFGDQAEEVYTWIQRLNKEMGINTQQFMQYSSVYATMLTGFGVDGADAGKMALGYTELTYDIWAGYNDVYKTFDEAAEAVKSAIAGEVEPVRRAGFTIVESTLEQTAANHGLEISLEKATEAQKSYLRYLTLVDQAHSQNLVGTYAAELNTAEGMMRTFSQQLKSLAQTFGSVFLPILVKVMPWLQAFVELLSEAIVAIAGFFGIEIQPVSWGSGLDGVAGSAGDAAGSLDDTADAIDKTTNALKDLKKATIGIDELNVISPPTQTGGSGSNDTGAGGAGWDGIDVDSLWDEAIFNQIQSQVDNIKEKIKEMLPIIGGITAAFAGWNLLKLLDNIDEASIKLGKLPPVIKGLAKDLTIAGITVAVGKLVWDFTGAYLESGEWSEWLKSLGTTAIGAGLAWKFVGKTGAAFVLAVSGIAMLGRLVFDLSEGTVDLGDQQTWITMITGSIETIIGGVLTWKLIGPKIIAGIKALFGGANMASIGSAIAGAFSSAWTAISGALASIPVWGWIAAAVVLLIGAAISLAITDYDFTDVGYRIGEAIGKGSRVIVDFASDIGEWILETFDKVWVWCKENITWDNIKGFVAVLFKKETWTEIIWPKVKEIGKAIWDGLWEGITEGLDNLWGNITEFVDGFIKGFNDGFEIHSPSKKFIEIGEQLVAGLIEPFNFSSIKEKLSGFWDSVVGLFGGGGVSEKVEVSVSLVKNGWKTVSGWIGKVPVVSQAITLAKSGWSTVRKWMGDLPTLSQAIKLVKSGWTTIKKWMGNLSTLSQSIKLVKSGWTTVKKWVGSIPVVSQAVRLAKSGWSSVKGWIGNIPTLSAPIRLVKSGWSTIKNWLGNLNFNIGFKLPRIGVNWGSRTFAGFKISYPTGFYTYAKGGFPDIGELFVAREAGPEMVGKIGNKTTVANNQQIVEAVSEGVYAAVVAAMRQSENNGGQAVNVYLDGRRLTSSVEKHQRERGATIMNNRSIYAY